MKEVLSRSRWVGKVLTCHTCQRSYIIEPGDEIKRCFTRSAKGGRIKITLPMRFDLPCGHYYPLSDEDYPPPVS